MPHNEEYVLEILREVGLLRPSQIEMAHAKAGAGSVLKELIEQGAISEEDVVRTLASQNGMEFIDLGTVAPPPGVLQALDADIARRYRAVPVALRDGTLVVAIGDPMDMETADALSFVLNREIEFVCATPDSIRKSLADFYGVDGEAGLEGSRELSLTTEGVGEETAAGDAPIIKMVSMLLLEAYNHRASDIHLEPLEKRFRVRFRIDGVLQEMASPPKKLQSAIISRLKIMSGSMSIAEKRLPQDGRIQVKLGKKSIDLRVSSIPTNHGESIVMRILDKTSLGARSGRSRFSFRRPGDVRKAHQHAGRHHAGHRADRFWQDDDALRVPALHEQARPKDHHGRGPGGVPVERHQPGAGECRASA